MSFIPPPDHPCATHGCDWCSVCQSGRCCGAVGHSVQSPPDPVAILRQAMEEDASMHPSFMYLMELDTLTSVARFGADLDGPPALVERVLQQMVRAPRALPPPSDVPLTIPTTEQKEAVRVIPKTR